MSVFTAFNNPGVYAVLNQTSSGCGCSETSAQTTQVGCKECSCCPPGTVEQKDADGKVVGCLTPNDSQGYMINAYRCPDGYVKSLDAEGNFMGCITVSDYQLLNP